MIKNKAKTATPAAIKILLSFKYFSTQISIDKNNNDVKIPLDTDFFLATCKIVQSDYNQIITMGEKIKIIDTPPGQAPEWVRQQ
jgi:hypothetical protein